MSRAIPIAIILLLGDLGGEAVMEPETATARAEASCVRLASAETECSLPCVSSLHSRQTVGMAKKH